MAFAAGGKLITHFADDVKGVSLTLTAMARVTLNNLSKAYPGPKKTRVPAVIDLNLEIEDGEFMILVGPSGCGKTTTLRLIAGLEDIDEGSITMDGEPVGHLHPKDRDVAMVFQHYALYPHLNVYDNMALGLKLRKYPKDQIRQRVEEAAQMLHITSLLDRMPHQCSGGQRQRVAVGRALVRKPKVFLFDEPLSNLDAQMRLQMRLELRELHQKIGATMIYVTHDQAEAMAMGDRMVVMHEGRLQQLDSPAAVYDHPANAFVAGFIGAPGMNLLPASALSGISLPAGLGISAHNSGGSSDGFGKEDHHEPTHQSSPRLRLGFRPERALIHATKPSSNSEDIWLQAKVAWLEPTGADNFLHLRVGEASCIVRTPASQKWEPQQEVAVQIPREAIRLFQDEDGKAISLG